MVFRSLFAMPPFAVSAVVNLDLIKGAMTLSKNKTATVFAISAAALYAINVPLSKLLLINVSPRMLAGFLYLGAGVGIGLATSKAVEAIARQPEAESKISKALLLGCALAEATAIYGFVIGLLILFVK